MLEFSNRGDIVYKFVLRDFRKFLIEDFNNKTRYVKKRRYKPNKFLIECLENYIDLKFTRIPESDRNDFMLKLGSICYHKTLARTGWFAKEENSKTVSLKESNGFFMDNLYKFTLTKLMEEFTSPYTGVLFIYYLDHVNLRKKDMNMEKINAKSYDLAIEKLL